MSAAPSNPPREFKGANGNHGPSVVSVVSFHAHRLEALAEQVVRCLQFVVIRLCRGLLPKSGSKILHRREVLKARGTKVSLWDFP